MKAKLKPRTHGQLAQDCHTTMRRLANQDILFPQDDDDNNNKRFRSALVNDYISIINEQSLKGLIKRIYNAGIKSHNTTNPDELLSDWISPLEICRDYHKELVLLAYCMYIDPVFMYHFWGMLEDVLTGFDNVEKRLETYVQDLYYRYQHNSDSSRFITARAMAGYGKLYEESKEKLRTYIESSFCKNLGLANTLIF